MTMAPTSEDLRTKWIVNRWCDKHRATWLPDMSVDGIEVSRFRVDGEDMLISWIRSVFQGRGTDPNRDYVRLKIDGSLWMTDTDAELLDMRDFYVHLMALSRHDQPHVLVTGLGMGLAAKMALDSICVPHVTVVERDQRVIDHIGGVLLGLPGGDRLTIVHDDAFEYNPEPRSVDLAWHDIWLDICADNVEEFKRIRQHYGRAMRRSKNQLCWVEPECQRLARGWYR